MNTSELVSAQHLDRKAIIYIRQSTPHQVVSNQESLRLQYALKQRAQSLGWRPEDIQIIDADLGLTGASAQHREGFKELVSQLTLGQVGIILSSEVTRLSRNCSDWYPLLDLCGYKSCLIADRDGVYDPGSPNGRLLLGLKGQISELELHTLRNRLTAGLLNKAQRGELALQLPIGLVRDEQGRVHMDPHREVQERIALVFSTFLQQRSASQVLRFFNAHELHLPRHDRFGDLFWKKPTVASILAVLKNPAYAGAFVYGRTRTTRQLAGESSQKRLPLAEWKICVKDKYPAYIPWQIFEQIQAMLQDNYAAYERNQFRGIPRRGSALLQGLVYCGECGHKMLVQYKGTPCYICNYLRQQYAVPVCQRIPSAVVDAYVVEAFFQALSAVELDSYERTLVAQQATAQQVDRAYRQQLERLHYEATLAQRRFNQVDPDNRLVAAELEKRWDTALTELKQAQETYARRPQTPAAALALSPELKAALSTLGPSLPALWSHPLLTRQNQKALLRCLIDKVILQRLAPDRVQVRIVWQGGDTTTQQLALSVGALSDLSTATEMERLILELSAQGQSDETIAQALTAQGHRSPMCSSVLPSTVQTIRLKHHLLLKRSQSHPRHMTGYLTVTEIAKAIDSTPHWVYDRIHNGCIQITKDPETRLYLFPDEPATLEQFKHLRTGTLQHLRFS